MGAFVGLGFRFMFLILFVGTVGLAQTSLNSVKKDDDDAERKAKMGFDIIPRPPPIYFDAPPRPDVPAYSPPMNYPDEPDNADLDSVSPATDGEDDMEILNLNISSNNSDRLPAFDIPSYKLPPSDFTPPPIYPTPTKCKNIVKISYIYSSDTTNKNQSQVLSEHNTIYVSECFRALKWNVILINFCCI